MTSQLDARLTALAAMNSEPVLAGLEDSVWAQVQSRKAAAAAGSTGVRVVLTATALAIGLAFGALHQQAQRPAQAHMAELGVLSEDGLLAPSVRLGGGA
ncbi:MAG: hypothetical protein ACXWK1_00925 [Caulobacteraceae bacterium]